MCNSDTLFSIDEFDFKFLRTYFCVFKNSEKLEYMRMDDKHKEKWYCIVTKREVEHIK